MDMMLLPTSGTTYRIDAVLADPVRLNSNLGLYTNFVNLMDLSAIAIPAGFRHLSAGSAATDASDASPFEGEEHENGKLPFGVTLIGRAFEDGKIAVVADRLHRSLEDPTVGATDQPLAAKPALVAGPQPDRIAVAVVGAHLAGQPLHWQLTDRKARFVEATRTASGYKLYALDTTPAKPGLCRDPGGAGGITVEIWELDFASFGSFVAAIPPPLGIGTLALEDGRQVKGFICEPCAIVGARDITDFGGWRNWLARPAEQS
jgi:allophanate hydrolase